jgi:hypothetical protein
MDGVPGRYALNNTTEQGEAVLAGIQQGGLLEQQKVSKQAKQVCRQHCCLEFSCVEGLDCTSSKSTSVNTSADADL